MKLQFDEQIALNLTGIPTCPASELLGKNIAAAWEQCGPGADGNPASEGNAYLSTGPGTASAGLGPRCRSRRRCRVHDDLQGGR